MRYARTASLVASLAAGVSSLSINITAGLPGFSSCPSFNESLPDYNCYPDCLAPSISPSEPISFGSHYTILNVDMISAVAGGIVKTPPGCKWIQNNQDWMGAVHSQTPAPLSIWTRIYHASARKPEITTNTPWAGEAGMLGDSSDPLTQIYSEFKPDPVNDVVLGKSRYYAGSGNSLETILEAQGIDTVIFSGIRTSGALLTTMYRFFDLDYKVYLIMNNTIELPQPYGGGQSANNALLQTICPVIPINVITIEQAMAGLKSSGPAVW